MTIPLLEDDTWTFWGAVVCPFFGTVLFIQVAFGFTSTLAGSVRDIACGVVPRPFVLTTRHACR